MKRYLLCIFLMFCCISGSAEQLDMNPVYEFSNNFGAQEVVKQTYEAALSGETDAWKAIAGWISNEIVHPVQQVLERSLEMLAPALLLALLQGCYPSGQTADTGMRFLLRMLLLLLFSDIACLAFDAAAECIRSSKDFVDAISPGVAAVLTAMGMTGTSVLVSPANALVGAVAEDVFLRYGIPLCKLALCLALAGNLSNSIDFSSFINLFRKAANWGAGIVTTLFTTMISMQAGISELVDHAGMKVAKFAVDSASPVIGNGVSDAWDGLVSGMLITKNALGMSGIVALLASGLKPVICCLTVMLALNLVAALLEIFGEKQVSRAAMQIGGVCQMALTLATASLVITTVLLGAAMSAGKGLLS